MKAGVTVILAIVGVAIIAELLSRSADTPGVLTALQKAISQMLCVALSPISGGGCVESVTSNITFGS